MRTIKISDIDVEAIQADGLNVLIEDLKGLESIEVNDEGHWYEPNRKCTIPNPWEMDRYIKQNTNNEGK